MSLKERYQLRIQSGRLGRLMSRFRLRPSLSWKFILPLCAVLLAAVLLPGAVTSQTIPTISIVGVTNNQVTIRTQNYPPNQTFTVRMGAMGTRGVNGIVAGSVNSGAGGSFTATFDIPEALRGLNQISIRLESPQGYFSYNWFYHNATAGDVVTAPSDVLVGTPGYTGIPTFSIVSVDPDQSVTLRTNNFPANQRFTVTMGPMFTRGINGTVVGTIDSGAGGTLERTFNIPDNLKGSNRISIRAQTAHANPYFAFNWFQNVAAPAPDPGDGEPGQGGQPDPIPAGYTGIPTFTVCAVSANQSATIVTNNFPPNQTLDVLMGPMGTRGINGTHVGTIQAGDGSAQRLTFNIPANLQGHARIAMRAQTRHAAPYFAYNWFYNNTAAVC